MNQIYLIRERLSHILSPLWGFDQKRTPGWERCRGGLKDSRKGFGMILAINQADARYSLIETNSRHHWPGCSVMDLRWLIIRRWKLAKQKRGSRTINVVFDMLLASLMTREGRVLLSPSQIQPVYEKVEVDKAAGTHYGC